MNNKKSNKTNNLNINSLLMNWKIFKVKLTTPKNCKDYSNYSKSNYHRNNKKIYRIKIKITQMVMKLLNKIYL